MAKIGIYFVACRNLCTHTATTTRGICGLLRLCGTREQTDRHSYVELDIVLMHWFSSQRLNYAKGTARQAKTSKITGQKITTLDDIIHYLKMAIKTFQGAFHPFFSFYIHVLANVQHAALA